MPSLVAQKQSLRRELRQTLSAMSTADRALASDRIREHLRTILHQADSPVTGLAAFAALPGEPELLPQALEPGFSPATWHLPRVEGEALLLFRVRSADDLVTTLPYGIREPDPRRCEPADLDRIDLILVPGLGFDPATGHRLGRGKGFYDRFLASARPGTRLIGVGFDRQLAAIPSEAHDIPLHAILTESGLREAKGGR